MRKRTWLLRAAVLVAWAASAAAQPAGVFLPAATASNQVDGEQRLVRISRSELAAARRDAQRQGAGRLAFNVADDVLIPAVVERTGRTPWGYSLSGRVDAPRGGTVTLVVHADVVSGTIWTPGGAWEIEPVAGDVHALRKVDPLRRRQGAEPLRMAPEPKGPDTAAAGMDDGTVVDVLVLWTPGTLALAGTEARLNIAIDLAVSTTNDAFENSGVDLRLNLVGAEQVDYAPSGNGGVDLDRLRDPADGFMDAVHARRDALGADLVSLLVDESNVGGIAYVLKRFNAAFRSFAFSLVWYGQGPYHRSITFAHELGHNMGLAHDRYVAGENDGIFGHSHGYVNLKAFEAGAEADACWLTIMAYDTRCDDAGFEAPLAVAYFSTPHRVYPDEAGDAEPAPLGVPKDSDAEHADGPADAVLTLASTRFVVANFRAERTDDGDARGAATPIGANATVVGDIEGPGDVDFYRIEVAEAGTLRIETVVLRPSRPPASDGSGFALSGVGCALQNSAGETVAADDGAADGEALWPGWVASCEASVGPGVYFVRLATGSGTDGTGPYTLTVAFDPRTAGDHGDTAGAATPLTLPATVAANLATETDVDYFRFSLPTTAALRVATTGSADTLGILTQLAAVGPPLRLTDDDSGPGANFHIESKAPRGDYLLRVASGGGSGDYVLEVAASTAADDHADSAADATPLAVGTALGGELEVANDLDYFRIDVPRAGQLWLTTEGDTDTMGELFSAAGESLADNDDGPVWPHFLVGVDASPGAYLLRVRGWSTSTGPYTVRAIYHADDRAVALFPSGAGLRLDGGGGGQLGFARLINRSSEPGVVFLSAADDAARAFGPAELKLPAGRSVHFNSRSLAAGDVPGLEGGLAQAEDDLRLTLETELDVEALAYVRTDDGFVTTMHETAPRHAGGAYRVAFFNPASNRNQRSLLRVANAGARVAEVTLTGIDDAGTPGEDALVFYVPPDGVRVLSAEALETGDAPFDLFGRLGDGAGKWELSLEADGDPQRRRHQNGFAPLRVMSLLASPTGNVTNLSTVPTPATGRIDVPLFLAAAGAAAAEDAGVAEDAGQQGFLRVINDSAVGGEVAIHAIDDAGERFGPVALRMGADQRIHFNSTHLESGNAALGLAGIGDGAGHWRLELNTSLTLTVLAYVRTRDGFVTSVHDRVPTAADGRHEVVFFNPGSNANQVSWLRLVNPGTEPAAVTIEGIDDMGEPAPEGAVTLTLAAGAAAKLTAAELEAGAPRFAGRFGDGAGKWRLSVRADRAIWVMSLLESPTGNLTNLSTRTLAVAADDGAP